MRKLNDLANRILDEKRPEMTRALDLYELQVGIFIPSQVKQARMYCGMMLLDHLGDAHGFRTGDLASASVVVEYRQLFDDIIGNAAGQAYAGLIRPRNLIENCNRAFSNRKALPKPSNQYAVLLKTGLRSHRWLSRSTQFNGGRKRWR
jgi:hypothetical protein